MFENTDLKEQRAATTRQGIIRMLACYEGMLEEEEVSLSRQTSVSDFFKSSSGTCVSPPELLDIGDGCPDDPTTVHDEALSPSVAICLLFHICCIFRKQKYIYFICKIDWKSHAQFTLHLWENLYQITSSRITSPVPEPPRRNLGG